MDYDTAWKTHHILRQIQNVKSAKSCGTEYLGSKKKLPESRGNMNERLDNQPDTHSKKQCSLAINPWCISWPKALQWNYHSANSKNKSTNRYSQITIPPSLCNSAAPELLNKLTVSDPLFPDPYLPTLLPLFPSSSCPYSVNLSERRQSATASSFTCLVSPFSLL